MKANRRLSQKQTETFASGERKVFLPAFSKPGTIALTCHSSGWPYHRLVKPTVAVGHRLTWRWHQLVHVAKAAFHSEGIAGRAVENLRRRTQPISCRNSASKYFPGARSRLVCAVQMPQRASFGSLQKVSGGKLVPTSQSSRQCGIRRFWFILSLLCRIAAYLIVRRKKHVL